MVLIQVALLKKQCSIIEFTGHHLLCKIFCRNAPHTQILTVHYKGQGFSFIKDGLSQLVLCMLYSESSAFRYTGFPLSPTKNDIIFCFFFVEIILICGLVNHYRVCARLNLCRLERSGYHYYLICLHKTPTYLLGI